MRQWGDHEPKPWRQPHSCLRNCQAVSGTINACSHPFFINHLLGSHKCMCIWLVECHMVIRSINVDLLFLECQALVAPHPLKAKGNGKAVIVTTNFCCILTIWVASSASSVIYMYLSAGVFCLLDYQGRQIISWQISTFSEWNDTDGRGWKYLTKRLRSVLIVNVDTCSQYGILHTCFTHSAVWRNVQLFWWGHIRLSPFNADQTDSTCTSTLVS